jgi:hypothetical protein
MACAFALPTASRVLRMTTCGVGIGCKEVGWGPTPPMGAAPYCGASSSGAFDGEGGAAPVSNAPVASSGPEHWPAGAPAGAAPLRAPHPGTWCIWMSRSWPYPRRRGTPQGGPPARSATHRPTRARLCVFCIMQSMTTAGWRTQRSLPMRPSRPRRRSGNAPTRSSLTTVSP